MEAILDLTVVIIFWECPHYIYYLEHLILNITPGICTEILKKTHGSNINSQMSDNWGCHHTRTWTQNYFKSLRAPHLLRKSSQHPRQGFSRKYFSILWCCVYCVHCDHLWDTLYCDLWCTVTCDLHFLRNIYTYTLDFTGIYALDYLLVFYTGIYIGIIHQNFYMEFYLHNYTLQRF